jgi:hypothetical protein
MIGFPSQPILVMIQRREYKGDNTDVGNTGLCRTGMSGECKKKPVEQMLHG